jgi:hypothetical protein
MKLPFLFTVLMATVIAMPGAWAQTDLQEGLWEISVNMELGGQPASEKPLVMRQCIAQQSAQELMSKLAGAGTCSTTDLRQEGNRATWKVACSSPVELAASGSADFQSESFEGSMNGRIAAGNQQLGFSQTFRARRVGACQ